MPIGVLEVMHPQRLKPRGTRPAKLLGIAFRGAPARRLPSRVVDLRHRSPGAREHNSECWPRQRSITVAVPPLHGWNEDGANPNSLGLEPSHAIRLRAASPQF